MLEIIHAEERGRESSVDIFVTRESFIVRGSREEVSSSRYNCSVPDFIKRFMGVADRNCNDPITPVWQMLSLTSACSCDYANEVISCITRFWIISVKHSNSSICSSVTIRVMVCVSAILGAVELLIASIDENSDRDDLQIGDIVSGSLKKKLWKDTVTWRSRRVENPLLVLSSIKTSSYCPWHSLHSAYKTSSRCVLGTVLVFVMTDIT